MAYSITLQTSDSGVDPGEKIGIIGFAASNEDSGSDATSIAASIHAEAEGEFTADSNKTSIVFSTASSGTDDNTSQLRISSSGHFLPITDNTKDLGASNLRFRNIFGNYGIFDNLTVDGTTVLYSGYIPQANRGIIYITDNSTTNINISGGYIIGSLDLFLNGSKLISGADFTATDGSGVAFSDIPESGSIVEFLTLFPASNNQSVIVGGSGHPDINAASSVDNSNNTFIQDLLLDEYGHITGIASATAASGFVTIDNLFNVIDSGIEEALNIQILAGTNIQLVYDSGTGTDPTGTLTINVTGIVSSVDETDPIFTGSIAYNITASDTGNWHTAYGWGNHADIGYKTSATDIYITGISFNTSNRNLTFSWSSGLSDLSVLIPASGSSEHPIINAASSSDNSGRTYIQDLLLDEYGHVTGIATATETVTPSGGGVLSGSGINDKIVASTGILVVYNTGTDIITISSDLNHPPLYYFLN